jgi:hypothetical protein
MSFAMIVGSQKLQRIAAAAKLTRSHLAQVPSTWLLVGMTLSTVGLAILSLRWEIFWDALEWHYQAFLINKKGFVPYRDVFDVNMFGTVFVHVVASRIFGYGDVGMRCFDLVWLTALCACTWCILRRLDNRAAWAGAIGFAWLYLTQSEMQLLQRDYLTLLPIAAAVAVALSRGRIAYCPMLRAFLIGILFGLASTLKPQALLGLPVVACFGSWQPGQDTIASRQTRPTWMRQLALAAAGCTVPLGAGFLWLWVQGALPYFMDIALHYWPIYTRLIFDGGIHTANVAERQRFILESILSLREFPASKVLIFSAAFIGVACYRGACFTGYQKACLMLLGQLALVYFLEAALVGAFHQYSWMPFVYFLVLLVALGFARCLRSGSPLLAFVLPVVAGASFICIWIPRTPERALRQLEGLPPDTGWTPRATEIADFLRPRLQPDDRVQSLDYLGGASRGLLLARAVSATSITMDAYLNFETQDPYVKQLRRHFLDRLVIEPPRFIVLTSDKRLFAYDREDEGAFRVSLDEFIGRYYRTAHAGDGYSILERTGTLGKKP